MTEPAEPQPGAQPHGRLDTSAEPLFAREAFRRVAGEALRPGGLTLTRLALDLAALPRGSLVADVGCGPGATARLLARTGHRVLALDLAPDMADSALRDARGPGVTVLRASAAALPVADACLDAVFLECVLSVTGAAGAVLGEAARALKIGGLLVLSDLYLRGGGELSVSGGAGGSPDCLSGARPRPEFEAALAAAGLRLLVFEDHSRLLAELAGKLVFAGLGIPELRSGCPSATGGARPGYFLCLARKATA